MNSHADLLEVEAEVLHGYLSDAITWALAGATTPPRRILDLGAGTGTGATALADRVPDAEVIAVDASEEHLARLDAKGYARIHTVRADLDQSWPTLDPVDLVWASMSLHHLADPVRVLRDVRSSLRPGGRLAVAELSGPITFLPDPTLEIRADAIVSAAHATTMPHRGGDWSALLAEAGFTEVARRTFTVELPPPHEPATTRYAEAWLHRTAAHLTDKLPPEDLTTLQSAATRTDLIVRTTRDLWLARG